MRLVSFIVVASIAASILFPQESSCGPGGKETKVVVAERGASRNNGKPKGEGNNHRVLPILVHEYDYSY